MAVIRRLSCIYGPDTFGWIWGESNWKGVKNSLWVCEKGIAYISIHLGDHG